MGLIWIMMWIHFYWRGTTCFNAVHCPPSLATARRACSGSFEYSVCVQMCSCLFHQQRCNHYDVFGHWLFFFFADSLYICTVYELHKNYNWAYKRKPSNNFCFCWMASLVPESYCYQQLFMSENFGGYSVFCVWLTHACILRPGWGTLCLAAKWTLEVLQWKKIPTSQCFPCSLNLP